MVYSIIIPEEMKKSLKILSSKSGNSIASLVRIAVQEFLMKRGI